VSRRRHLLISCRDPGSAGHLGAVAQAAMLAPDLRVSVCAAPPALEILTAAGIAVAYPVAASDTPEELLAAAARILAKARPDLLLTGISGPDCGIDEALLARAERTPRLAYQDFWGYVNRSLGAAADLYLVQDDEAARLTRERFELPSAVVGAPKYARYAALDAAALRREFRRAHGIDERETLIAFCGQPLWDRPGYAATLDVLFSILRRMPDHRLLLRPHPKEHSALPRLRELLERHGIRAGIVSGGDAEPLLCACDLLLSAFSNCCVDLAYLNRLANGPGATPVYLMFEPDLRATYQSWNGLDRLPPVELGVALEIRRSVDLEPMLRRALQPASRAACRRAARERLPDPARAITRILEEVRARL